MEISKVLNIISDLVGAFNPVIGKGVNAISRIAAALEHLDDDNLQNISGLGYISNELKEMAEKESFDKERIEELAEMIDAISLILEKNYILIK